MDGILNFEYLFRTVSRSTRRDDGGTVEVHFLFDYLYDQVVQCIYTLLGKKVIAICTNSNNAHDGESDKSLNNLYVLM